MQNIAEWSLYEGYKLVTPHRKKEVQRVEEFG